MATGERSQDKKSRVWKSLHICCSIDNVQLFFMLFLLSYLIQLHAHEELKIFTAEMANMYNDNIM